MEPPRKRAKILADEPMDLLGSKGLLKKSEFVRIITDALVSLGFHESATLLEKESGIPLYNSVIKQFLELVKHGEWDESIDELQGIELRDEKAVKLLLLEQQYFELLKMKKAIDAMEFLRQKIVPLSVDEQCLRELAVKLISASGEEDTESVNSSSNLVEKLQNLFPPAVIIPKGRLEYLLETTLDRQRIFCDFHNVPDSDLSLCFGHHCYDHKIPSKTIQTLEEHTDEVWFVKFSHNGKCLASSSKDKSAIIWEIDAEGKFSRKHKLVGHEKPVVEVLWSPDDVQVITCGQDEVIRCWNVDSGVCVQSYERNGVGSVSCGWFHDGSGIIGGMADKRIYLWNLDGTTNTARSRPTGTETSKVEKVISEEEMITSFSLSNDSNHILINLRTKGTNLWNIGGDEPYKYHEYSGHKRSRFIIRSCFGGYEESFIASGSEDSQVYIWHKAESIEPLRKLRGHTGAVNCVSWNPIDLHMLASASDDGTIRIWGLDIELDNSEGDHLDV